MRYRFPPLERRGVIAGWRGGQIATVATGLLCAVLALRAGPSAAGVVAAVIIVSAAVALAFWPVAGRTGEQWLPLVVRWAWAGAAGRRRQLHPGPRRGVPVAVDVETVPPSLEAWRCEPQRGPLGGRRTPFDGLEIEAVAVDPALPSVTMGVVVDRPGRALTAVLALRGNSFALLGPDDQDAWVGAWARGLASLAREGCAVHRVQWVETCLPDDGAAVHGYVDERAVLGAETPAGASYRALVDESSPVTRRHQVVLAVTMRPARAVRLVRAAGGGLQGSGALLAREVDALRRALEGAEVIVDGVLGPGALGAVLAEPWRSAAEGTPPPIEDRPPGTPWPMAVEASWDAVRTDGVWHAVYWIAEWPRVEVTPDFLGPLLFAPLRRSLSLVMEPVGPVRAAREVAQSRTADLADGELRRRGGFLVTARHTRERESVEARDTELADGHAQFRFSGYLTVTADSRDELTAAASALEQAAGQARLEVRLLYGQQDAALLCGIPVGRGLASSRLPPGLPAHVATTRHLGAAYPLVSEAGLGHEGVLIGRDLLGGSFVYDPFSLYGQGVVTNPNMVVIGQIGRGKSSFVKSYLWRQAVFGRNAWVVDPKGEYGRLAEAWGVVPLSLRPGGTIRLNPLDTAASGDGPSGTDPVADGRRRRTTLTASLAVACLGRDLLPRERAAVDAAVGAAEDRARDGAMDAPTLPQVVEALLDPGAEAASALRTTRTDLMEEGRDVALELRRLVHGDLRGMFDGPTTDGLRLDGPLVVLDLAAVYHSPALGVLMACAAAWLQHAVSSGRHRRVLLVVDEAWAILGNLGVARWLQTSWKLSRALGVANMAVLHRLSDLAAVGAVGSEQVGLAEGLLADSETRVVYAQSPGEVARTGELLGLTATEAELVTELRRGTALWKVGRRSFLVEHRLAAGERWLADTDEAMSEPFGVRPEPPR